MDVPSIRIGVVGTALNARDLASRAAIVALLTIAAIVVHESGHFIGYRLAGYPVHVTLQSVHPVGAVNPSLDLWAKAAGPAVSLVAAVACLAVAQRRRSFTWATASFTNASLRLFPLLMDLLRAVKGAPAFSDEGEVARAVVSSNIPRATMLALLIGISLLVTTAAARQYHFARRPVLKSLCIYVVSLAVGIAVVIVDELLKL